MQSSMRRLCVSVERLTELQHNIRRTFYHASAFHGDRWLVVGVMGVRLAKSANARKALQSTAARGGETVRTGLNQARTGVRDAAVSGLKTIEKTSATLQRKLTDTPPEKLPDIPMQEGSAGPAGTNDGEEAS